MKIGIIGTRGIPNHYGGFEQFAEFFSIYLAKKKHQVYVYCSSLNPYKNNKYHNVNRIVYYDPEQIIGTIGQFIYDLNCILDTRKRNFDIILQLGYTSNAIWSFLLPKNSIIVTNMDGLEWKRSKYSKKVQQFLKFSERLAIQNSDYLIADSIQIQSYLKKKYQKDSKYIAYGSNCFDNPNIKILNSFGLNPFKYHLLIARMERENHIEMIIQGILQSDTLFPLILIGNPNENSYGKYLQKKYNSNPEIKFLGGIYDLNILNNLRYFSELYFHGHSVGGTNPSLLEAMGSKTLIIAHRNEFNYSILESNAFYFSHEIELSELIRSKKKSEHTNFIQNNYSKIKKKFNWELINNMYLNFIKECLQQKK